MCTEADENYCKSLFCFFFNSVKPYEIQFHNG